MDTVLAKYGIFLRDHHAALLLRFNETVRLGVKWHGPDLQYSLSNSAAFLRVPFLA